MRTDRNEMGSRRRSTTGDNANEISRAVDAAMSGSGNCGVPDAAGAPSSRGDRANQKSQSRSGQRRKRRLIFESLGQRRVLAVITGAVFNDADGSMRQDPTEIRLESRLAFIDSNDNAILDSGESYAITDADGQFQFDNLDPGTYPVRLFNTSSGQASSGRGSSGQRQTYPTGAIQSALPTSFEAPIDAVLAGDQLNVLTAGSLHQINTSGTRTSQIPLGFEATGLVAAVSNPALGVSASMIVGTFDELGEGRSGIWLVRSGGDGPQLLHYSPNPHAFSSPSAAVGADGKGVVIEAGENSEDSGTVLAVQVTARSAENTTGEPISVQVTPTNATVPSNTQVLASQTSISLSGNDSTPSISSRTVFAWPVFATTGTSQTGFQSIPALKTSLWSNGAGSWIEGSETVIVGATELVSFDDQAGLLAVRYAEGDLGILDVDAGFAPLHQLSGVNGPSTFVTGEEAIASIRTNVDGDMLILHDIRSGEVLARQPLDLESIGQPVSVISGATFDSYLLVGDSGVLSIELEQPVAHYVQLNREDASQSILFGLQVDGENQAPQTRPHVEVSAIEDHRLTIDASEIASLVTDANHDRLVSLIVQEPQNGEVTISPDGAVRYMPNQDYNGPDSFAIGFHDGQSESQPIQFSVSVAAQPDAPSGIRFRGDAIPEHTEGRYEVGTIEIDDVDLNNHYVLNVLDSRFQVENGKLILVDGGLNYEHEHQIQLTLAGYDNEAGQYFSHDIIILVEDENDPIDEVYADLVPLAENQQGVFVATLGAIDEDEGQTITFSVDDPRFEVIGDELWLKPGESIDYETESVVVLNITADDNAGSTATTEIRVSIIDVPEAVTQISLSNETVLEFEAGATVGDVLLDGVPAADSYRLTVDDPRFEIDGSELKLLDDQWVRRSAAEQIELTITAQDNNANFDSISGTFVIEVLPNETPFHNDDDPYDVDGNGVVTPRDALAIINYLNLYGPGPVGPGDPGYGYDVNGDGQVT
ncbi:MAG: cadherin-like domain-containing protein, partial [Planctomycetales bacterium]|nr:cadherin-like domain-containing protein [Planctomycetales bacterium]